MFTFRAMFGALPNYGDEATLSGGDWEPTLPIDNVKSRILKKVARSTDAATASTQWEGDFGATKTIGICGLLNLNWSTSAKWRFRVKAALGGAQPTFYCDGSTNGVIASGAGLIYGQTGDFALGFWVRWSENGSRDGIFGSWSDDLLPAYPGGVLIEVDGSLTFQWTKGGQNVITTSPTVLVDELWHYVGISVTGSTIEFSIDGELFESFNDGNLVGRDAGVVNSDIVIGRQGTSHMLVGELYYVAHWSVYRTPAEFASDMFRTWSGSETNLTGLWSGVVSAGPILNNLTANNHDFAVVSFFAAGSWNEAPTLYDSGILDAFPPVEEFGALPWGEFQWGGALPAEIAGALTPQVFHICTEVVQGRYYSVEVFDATNVDGYIDVGRAMIGPYFQPSLNMDYGYSLGYEDESVTDKSRGGQLYAELHNVFRAQRFSFSNMSESEALSQVLFYLQRRLGTTGDFLFIPFPMRPELAYITAIYCRMRSLPPVYNSAFDQWQTQFELEELL